MGARPDRGEGAMTHEQRLTAERWLSWVRVGAIPFAVFQTAITAPYPAGHAAWAWGTTGALGFGATVFYLLARRELSARDLSRVGFAALAFDFLIVSSFVLSLD